jgi:hypothetical protein
MSDGFLEVSRCKLSNQTSLVARVSRSGTIAYVLDTSSDGDAPAKIAEIRSQDAAILVHMRQQ